MEITKEKRDSLFKTIYNTITGNVNRLLFLDSIMINYNLLDQVLTVDHGVIRKFELADLVKYKVAMEVVEMVLKYGKEVPQELHNEFNDVLTEVYRTTEESVVKLQGVKLHFIPASKKCVVLTRKPLEFNLGDGYESTIVDAIAHSILCRKSEEYAEDEIKADEIYDQFYERMNVLEEDDNNEVDIIKIHEFKRGNKDLTIQVVVNKDRSSFFTLVLDGSTVVNSSYRNYNTPSTLNSLAWDYVKFTK